MKAAILIGHLSNKGNEGAIIRTAEAFGITNVFVIGEIEPSYHSSEGCDRHINFFKFKNFDDLIDYAKSNNYKFVLIENLNEATEIGNIEYYPANPIFVMGNESDGIPQELIPFASKIVKIKQGLGYANCLNVGVATGIVIHDFFKKELNKKNKYWTVTRREG